MRNYTGHGQQGKNYNPDLTIKDIAKKLKQELKQMFPDCKFSVTTESYSGGQSLNINLMSAPFDAVFTKGIVKNNTFIESENSNKGYCQLNPYTLQKKYVETPDIPGYNNGTIVTEQAWRVLKFAVEKANSYNYDDSDGMIDYFDTNFYLHVEIGKWNKSFKQEQ